MTDSHASPSSSRSAQVGASSAWAAWADALGFISELASEQMLKRRLQGATSLVDPIPWIRRVGGKFGVDAQFPAGTYSDDTQLRLSTSRAISGSGFDPEAFAQVELPIWPAYALGGGRSTKAAAVNLSRPGVSWFNNFYVGWEKAGGNGAAMRIQPHVWSAKSPGTDTDFLADVLANSLTSHGHVHALVGATLNAVAVASAISRHTSPLEADWENLLSRVKDVHLLTDRRVEIATAWRPAWEKATGERFASQWTATAKEASAALESIRSSVADLRKAAESKSDGDAQEGYRRMLDGLGLMDDARRGSGLLTVVAALGLVAAFPTDPRVASRIAARAVGSDTDSIATMAAAIIGASGEVQEAPPIVLDSQYLAAEAEKLAEIAMGNAVGSFPYPDLLRWAPPKSQIETVGLTQEGTPAISGLAVLVEKDGEIYESREAQWRWYSTDFGQSMLLKHRGNLRHLPNHNLPLGKYMVNTNDSREVESRSVPAKTGSPGGSASQSRIVPGRENDASVELSSSWATGRTRTAEIDVDQMLGWIVRRGLQDSDIGYAVRRLAQKGTIEQQIGLNVALRGHLVQNAQEVLAAMSLSELEEIVLQSLVPDGVWHLDPLGRSSDSVDVLITKPEPNGTKLLIHIKHSRNALDSASVRRVVSALGGTGAIRAILVTMSSLTSDALEIVRSDGRIDVIDGEHVADIANRRLGRVTSHGAGNGAQQTGQDSGRPGIGRFEVYQDRAGLFRFRLKAANGRVVATGEAFETKEAAYEACQSVQLAAGGALLPTVP